MNSNQFTEIKIPIKILRFNNDSKNNCLPDGTNIKAYGCMTKTLCVTNI